MSGFNLTSLDVLSRGSKRFVVKEPKKTFVHTDQYLRDNCEISKVVILAEQRVITLKGMTLTSFDEWGSQGCETWRRLGRFMKRTGVRALYETVPRYQKQRSAFFSVREILAIQGVVRDVLSQKYKFPNPATHNGDSIMIQAILIARKMDVSRGFLS